MLGVASIAGTVSCGNKSEKASDETDASYAQTERDYGMRSSSTQSTKRASQATYREESRNVETADNLSICNTKWSFTDAQGNGFVLKINGMSRDGESAKTELEKNGTIVEYNTIKPEYRDYYQKTGFMGYIFGSGTGNASDGIINFSSSERGWLSTALWDYNEGFLYRDRNAYDAEAPTRLKIKKAK